MLSHLKQNATQQGRYGHPHFTEEEMGVEKPTQDYAAGKGSFGSEFLTLKVTSFPGHVGMLPFLFTPWRSSGPGFLFPHWGLRLRFQGPNIKEESLGDTVLLGGRENKL